MDVTPLSHPAAASIEWEETACLLCGGRSSAPLLDAADPLPGGDPNEAFRVVRCGTCGLCFTNPRPSARSIGRFYPDDYSPYQYRDPIAGKKRWRPWPKPDPVEKVLPLPPGGRLLDFGCGAGEFLQRMNHVGWHVTGLDFSPRMVESIRANLGLAAFAGTLPNSGLPAGSFEAVTMWQALEHVHEPLDVLRDNAHRLLTAGGRVLVAVPNIDSLPFRWFGTDWFGLDVPRHLTHFSPGTLSLMLERAGFRVERVQMIRHNSWLRNSARLARRHAAERSLWCRLMRNRLLASLAGWYSYVKSRANCILAVGVRG